MTGLTLTKACSQPGMDCVGVRMSLPKTSGNMNRKPYQLDALRGLHEHAEHGRQPAHRERERH